MLVVAPTMLFVTIGKLIIVPNIFFVAKVCKPLVVAPHKIILVVIE
jgi:hypothetical protein